MRARFAYQTDLELVEHDHDRKMPCATGYPYAQFLRAANVGVGLGVEPVASLRDDVAFLIFRVLRVAHLAKDATRVALTLN